MWQFIDQVRRRATRPSKWTARQLSRCTWRHRSVVTSSTGTRPESARCTSPPSAVSVSASPCSRWEVRVTRPRLAVAARRRRGWASAPARTAVGRRAAARATPIVLCTSSTVVVAPCPALCATCRASRVVRRSSTRAPAGEWLSTGRGLVVTYTRSSQTQASITAIIHSPVTFSKSKVRTSQWFIVRSKGHGYVT